MVTYSEMVRPNGGCGFVKKWQNQSHCSLMRITVVHGKIQEVKDKDKEILW